MKIKEMSFTVDYVYENIWGELIDDRHLCDTREEAIQYMEDLKATQNVKRLVLMINEKYI